MLIKLAAANCPHSGSRPNHGVALPIHLECWPSERLTCSACTEISSVSRNCHGGPSRPSSIARAINSHQTSKDLGIVIEELISQGSAAQRRLLRCPAVWSKKQLKEKPGMMVEDISTYIDDMGPRNKVTEATKAAVDGGWRDQICQLKTLHQYMKWYVVIDLSILKKNHDENLWVWP